MNLKFIKKIAINFIGLFVSIYMAFKGYAFYFHKGIVTKEDIKKKINENGKVFGYFKFLFMPTRIYSEIVKYKYKDQFPTYMNNMTKFYLSISIFVFILFLIFDKIVSSIDSDYINGLNGFIQINLGMKIFSYFSCSFVDSITYFRNILCIL